MNRRIHLRILALPAALLLAAQLAPAQHDASREERTLFVLTNQLRAEHHLPLFTWDPALARAARLHAWRIATEPGPLEHQYPGEPDLVTRASRAGAHFEIVSENIARRALTPAALLDAWMHTAPHRAAILNPRLTSIGTGVANDRGLLSGVQDFSAAVPVLTRDLVEAHVLQLLRDRGIRSVAVTEGAREVCRHDAQNAPGARLVIHWQGPDLSALPPAVAQQLSPSSSSSVAVGACHAGANAESFTTGHIALLLY